MVIAAVPEQKQLQVLDWSPEHQLILACARCQPDIALIHHVLDHFETTLDWDQLIQAACWHGVLPLVYCSLSRVAPHRIPKAALSQLMKLYLMNSVHNQRLTSTLQELVALFKAHHIPVMFFKGPVLAEVVYGSIHLRRFSDLDLLIHEADIAAVRQLLIREGFQSRRLMHSPNSEDYLQSRTWDDTFTHAQTQVVLDLHWQLMPNYFPVAFDLEKIWLAQQPFVIHQTELYSLSPSDLVLYLCAHGSKELWRHLIWVCDIAEVVRAYPDLPWQAMLEQAKTLKIERMFLLGLALAHQFLDMPLPLSLEHQVLHHPVVKDLTQIFRARIFEEVETLMENQETGFWLFHNPLHLRLRDRLQDRLPQYWLTLKFFITPNAEDQQFLSLPTLLRPLHYLVRPIRIAYKWAVLRRFQQS